MKIGVTGGTGFLGGVLIEWLKLDGHFLRLLSRPNVTYPPDPDPWLERFFGNLSDPDDLLSFCEGMDIVCHLAGVVVLDASAAEEMEQINVQASRMLAEACLAAGVKRLIHCSSISALSPPGTGESWDENRPLALHDRTAYNRSKARAEVAVLEVWKQGLDVVIVNPTGVIGPYDHRPSLAGQNILDTLRGKSPATVGGGFDFVDVRDVAEGIVLAIEKGRAGERYILGGHYLPLRDLVREICKLSGHRPPRIHLPVRALYGLLPLVRLWSRIVRRPPPYTREMIDATIGGEHIVWHKAKQELGYRSRPIGETIADTVKWFRKNMPE